MLMPIILIDTGSHYYQLETWAVLGFAFAQIIFQIRIFALYGMKKALCIAVFSVFLCSMGLTAWIVITSTKGLTAIILQPPGVNMMMCLPTIAPSLVKAVWIPTICFETLLCALALLRGYQTSDPGSHMNGNFLMTILIRDSAIYYLLMASAHVASLIISIVSWEGYLSATVSFSLAMSCVLSSRVVLNIREITKIESLHSSSSGVGNLWFNRTNSTGQISWHVNTRETTA
ncbi:hypothetical protein JR316_0008962 [Psilocybe cubensis]|uniref:Uncharacterized protein n=2 Tax=Psilocybe cubensis TaxID=181762 RepID=A0A8H7XWI0_PSICU|nr:hypothetical protein JR316_0008962 [Psilocybe cubensis]KAH9478507.1 hypothetical protein JR316_0008962 [Psilocybe cubensis]